MNENYPRLVSWSYYDGQGLFSNKSDREVLTEVFITDPKGEDVLKRGELACLTTTGMFSRASDPYFKVYKKIGYTRRAKSHGKIVNDALAKYPELRNKLGGIKSKLLDYGEYVFIGLSYLDNYTNPIVEQNKAFFNKNFVYKECFTAEFLMTLINYRPRDLFGSKVIESYEKEQIPQLIIELKRKYPVLYKEIYEMSIVVQELDKEITYVGKKARLSTLKPGQVELQLSLLEKEVFDWDGSILIRKGKVYNGESITHYVKPSEDLIVKILDDNTVDENSDIRN